jgi:hypothetical protein
VCVFDVISAYSLFLISVSDLGYQQLITDNCGNDTEIVTQWAHLGHMMNDNDDIHNPKLRLFAQSDNFLCDFACLNSVS